MFTDVARTMLFEIESHSRIESELRERIFQENARMRRLKSEKAQSAAKLALEELNCKFKAESALIEQLTAEFFDRELGILQYGIVALFNADKEQLGHAVVAQDLRARVLSDGTALLSASGDIFDSADNTVSRTQVARSHQLIAKESSGECLRSLM